MRPQAPKRGNTARNRTRSASGSGGTNTLQRIVFYGLAIVILILFYLWVSKKPQNSQAQSTPTVPKTSPVFGHLQELYRAMRSYAEVHQGQFPDRLEMLVPQYVSSPEGLLPPLDQGSGRGPAYQRGPVKTTTEGLGVLLRESQVRAAEADRPAGRYTLYTDGTVLFAEIRGDVDL
jgi:hypothetical protein